MEVTTDGRFRVLSREGDAYVLVDLAPTEDPADAYEPMRVAAEGYEGELGEAVAALEPGFVVDAELAWTEGDARFASLSVRRRGRFLFADDVENLFEAARDTWQDARAAGDGMASRVTHDTDGEPNGALYVFADAGARDLLAEFRNGTTPVEPLVQRVNEQTGDVEGESGSGETANDEGDDPPEREVFVLRPADGAFVVVYVAFAKDGLLARTVRDTYF
ncbi:hypothetical protein HUG10_17885 [Halorarum halophilum]|uniref:Uncharacterized protein n=1 Tax=Halorarum halophilum TaxID=2743090 RepID=A0A7D5GNB6_9EURY|nr:DUF6663 family protein [Halobaculum halophilum]QLG29287.1 hypothetical protein HUG10_17885 [Halobaculum halophilum]